MQPQAASRVHERARHPAGFEPEKALALAEGILNGGSIRHGRSPYNLRACARNRQPRGWGCFTREIRRLRRPPGWPGSLRVRHLQLRPERSPAAFHIVNARRSGKTVAPPVPCAHVCSYFRSRWVPVSWPSTSARRAVARCRDTCGPGVLDSARGLPLPQRTGPRGTAPCTGTCPGCGSTCSGPSSGLTRIGHAAREHRRRCLGLRLRPARRERRTARQPVSLPRRAHRRRHGDVFARVPRARIYDVTGHPVSAVQHALPARRRRARSRRGCSTPRPASAPSPTS